MDWIRSLWCRFVAGHQWDQVYDEPVNGSYPCICNRCYSFMWLPAKKEASTP